MQRLNPAERAERLLSLIPWVLENGGQTIAELEERFAYPSDMLVADLENVVHYLAPFPFTPDVEFSVFINGADQVWISNAEVFSRPPMFTFAQAFELFVAASAVLQAQALPQAGTVAADSVPADSVPESESPSPLARAVAKLAPDSSGDLTQLLRVDVGENIAEDLWEALNTAVEQQRRMQIEYFTQGRSETSTRKVDAYSVFARAGSWHFRGWCHKAQDLRTFRCDQIESFQLLDEQFEPAGRGKEKPEDGEAEDELQAEGKAEDASDATLTYHANPDDPRATIEVSPWAARLAEEYDADSAEQTEDGNIRMRLPVGRRIFLERLLLQAGNAVKVVSVEGDIPEDIAQQAASRVLARYRH